jgi:hypothetical protein
LEYEVYRHKDCTQEDFETMDRFFKDVEKEDIDLCNNVQKSFNSDTYIKGPLHPHNEKGVIYFKSLIKDVLYKHMQEEQKAGGKIFPARRENGEKNDEIAEEEAFCRLACDGNSGPKAVPQW